LRWQVWIRGERKMSIDTLAIISKILGLSTDYLLYGSNHYMENMIIHESYDGIYRETMDNELKELLVVLKGSTKKEISLIRDISKLILPYLKK